MQTIIRAHKVLRCFTTHKREMTLDELAEMCGFDKAKTRRYLLALVEDGFVERLDRRHYALGPGALRVASTFGHFTPLANSASPIVRRLRDASKRTAYLTVLSGDYPSVVMEEKAKRDDKSPSLVGATLPMHATADGMVMLSYMPLTYQDRILRRKLHKLTRLTVVDKPKLRAQLRYVGAAGYCHEVGSFEEARARISSPFFARERVPLGAISVAFPASAMSQARLKQLARMVVRAAVETSKKLGGEPHEVQTDMLSGQNR